MNAAAAAPSRRLRLRSTHSGAWGGGGGGSRRLRGGVEGAFYALTALGGSARDSGCSGGGGGWRRAGCPRLPPGRSRGGDGGGCRPGATDRVNHTDSSWEWRGVQSNSPTDSRA